MTLAGVGLQLNPTILGVIDDDLAGRSRGEAIDPSLYSFAELLCDQFAAPLDCGYVIDPATRPLLERLAASHRLVAHGNYGNEFGYEPLHETPSVLRHLDVARAMESPFYADHMFFGFQSSSYMWSSPLQFSRSEVPRVAARAAALQDRLKMPLLHENAFYYAPFPGSDMEEAEFIASVVDRAQTHLLLDLHNVYSNAVNFEDYDIWRYLRTIPLDRVVEIHLAGGERIGDWYHDFHNHAVPETVWQMLDYVIPRAPNLAAVTLEVQGPAHNPLSRAVDMDWGRMINADLRRARALWTKHRGELAA